MASNAANKLENVRRLARDIGIPLDASDKLAISIPRAARLLDIRPDLLRRLLQEDGIPLLSLGRGNDRIDLVDLVEFVEARKGPGRQALHHEQRISEDLCEKLDAMTRHG